MEINQDYLEVGIVINTFGVKGEVKVMPLTDTPDQLTELKVVYLAKPGGAVKEFEVRKIRTHKKWVILRLKGIDDRDTAGSLKDYNLYVQKEALGELAEDTYYEKDLHGVEVYNTKDEFLGVISDILKTPANDVYEIRAEGGGEILIPAIKDVIKNIDLAANKMIIDPLQGLI